LGVLSVWGILDDVERHLLDWLVRYGTPVLFMAQLLGIFGLPIPDELLLTIAGMLVRKGQLHLVPTLVAAITGCVAGITISYVLGRSVGLATLQRVLHVHEESLVRAQAWFRRFGCWLLAFGYFIPGVRHVTALAAGSTPLEYSTFSRYAYPGAVLWSSLFLALGYFGGDRAHEMLGVLRRHLTIVAAVLVVLAGAHTMWSARRGIRNQG
jgi:membrane protein DedA with SNARE-associated domain